MGIASFFKAAGNFIKSGGVKKLIRGGIEAFKKVQPHIRRAIDKGSKFMIKLPGYIDQGKRIYDGGRAFVRDITDALPNSRAKDKINSALDKFDNKVETFTDKGRSFADSAQQRVLPIMNSTNRVIDKLNGYATDFNNH